MDSFDLLSFDTRTVDLQKQIGDYSYIGKVLSSPLNYVIKVSKNPGKTDLNSLFKNVRSVTELWTPSLVPITNAAYSKENKTFYIVTKLFSNGTLQQHLEPKISPQWTPTSAAITVLGLAHALKIIHSRGVAHKKLQPSKIVFDDKMYPHLIDSWLSDSPQDVRYVAPELMAHSKADEKAADIFSFALIYFHCVSGISPFDGIYQAQIGPYFFSGQRPPIPDSIPKFSKQLISKCWDQDPRQRPSAEDIFQLLQEHYTEIAYDASFAEITKYSKMLYKYPMRCFYSKMGDPSSCIKMGQMLREYEISAASQLYMQMARSTPQTLQKPKNQYQQRFMQNISQSIQNGSVMQEPYDSPPAGILDMSGQLIMNGQQVPQAQPMMMQQPVIMNGQQYMMQPVMINGQMMMQPVLINSQMQNRAMSGPPSVVSTGSRKKSKRSGASSSAGYISEEERLRVEAERIRQENERIRVENERMRLEEERNRLEREREDALRRAMQEPKGRKGRFDSDTFIDTPSLEPQSTTDTYEQSASMSFSGMAQSTNYQPKPSTHRREELANARKKQTKSSSSRKRKQSQSTTESIFEAAEKGDIQELQRYIEQEGISANVHDTFRSTPLHLACENGHDNAARYLISKGASVNKTDKWHKTPLHWAAQGGFTNIVRTLLDKGADVSIADKWGSIPLQLAAEKDHADAVALLVDAGSPIEHQDNSGKTAMALSKDENIRAMLQSNGAQPRVCFVLP